MKLNKTMLRECHMNLEHFKAADALDWVFSADVLQRAAAVKGIVTPGYKHENYHLPNTNITLTLDFENLPVPPIMSTAATPDLSKCATFVAAIKTAQEIQHKYARVKHLLRWLDANATPGAIRTYWPAVVALCPRSAIAKLPSAPARCTTPHGIGEMLPLIRETAGTVAAMQMIPADITTRGATDMWIALPSSREELDGTAYAVEAITVNL
jgi:hypothetical protein